MILKMCNRVAAQLTNAQCYVKLHSLCGWVGMSMGKCCVMCCCVILNSVALTIAFLFFLRLYSATLLE